MSIFWKRKQSAWKHVDDLPLKVTEPNGRLVHTSECHGPSASFLYVSHNL